MVGMMVALLSGPGVKAEDTPPQDPAAPVAPAAPIAPAPTASAPTAPAPTAPAPIATAPAPAPAPQLGVQSVAPEDAEAVLGQRVADPEGNEIGRLVDVLVGANGQPQAAVIDFGGFMGVGNRKIAVHWSALQFSPSDPKYKVALEITPDQIKTAPEFRNPNKAAAVVTPEPAISPR